MVTDYGKHGEPYTTTLNWAILWGIIAGAGVLVALWLSATKHETGSTVLVAVFVIVCAVLALKELRGAYITWRKSQLF